MTEGVILDLINAGGSLTLSPTSRIGEIRVGVLLDGKGAIGDIELARKKDEDDDMRLAEKIAELVSRVR